MKKRKNKLRIILWIIITVIVLSAAFFILKDVFLRGIYPLDFKQEITANAKEFSLDPYFVASVIWAESRFKQTAVSSKGAMGLMQIMPDTGEWIAGKLKIKEFKLESLNEPKTNIRFGCWYLRYIKEKFGDGDTKKMLAAYNAGPGRVEGWLNDKEVSPDGVYLDNIPYPETHDYVEKIERAYEVYKQLYKFD